MLTESDERSSMVTTWVVTPEGPGCRVQVETRWQGVGGVGGLFERLFAPRVLRRLYDDELKRLDRYARTLPPAEPNPADGHQRANASGPTATALSSR